MTSRFSWGDPVRVVASAPQHFRPSAAASVVGIREVLDREQAAAVNEPVGTRLYLLEFSDGKSIEVPPRYLEPLPE